MTPLHPRHCSSAPICDESNSEATAWATEWTKLLGLTTDLLTSADALLGAMRGDLGPDVRTTEQAAPIIAERIDAWQQARRDLIAYAREAQGC